MRRDNHSQQERPMFRRLAAILGLGTALALGGISFLGASFVAAGDPCYHSFQMPEPSTGTETEIKLDACAFSPTVTQVPAGSTVKFVNGPDFVHLVTGANQAWGSRDAELAPGKTVSYRFDSPGVYPFACALHRGMSGAIVVEAATTAGGAATAADISTPNGDAGETAVPVAEPFATDIALVAIGAALGGLVAVSVTIIARRWRRADPVATPEPG